MDGECDALVGGLRRGCPNMDRIGLDGLGCDDRLGAVERAREKALTSSGCRANRMTSTALGERLDKLWDGARFTEMTMAECRTMAGRSTSASRSRKVRRARIFRPLPEPLAPAQTLRSDAACSRRRSPT